jgi:hypothetical protein
MNKLSLFTLAVATTASSLAQSNTFPASGNVGIGTTTPDKKLVVTDAYGIYEVGSNSAYWSGFKTNAPAGFWGFQQNERMFMGVGGNVYNRGFSPNAMGIFNGSTTPEDIFLFNQNNPGAGVLVLKAGGNVGIGTSSPQAKLDVAGNANFLNGNLHIDNSWNPNPVFQGTTFVTRATLYVPEFGAHSSVSLHTGSHQTAFVTDGPIMSLENGAYFAGNVGIGTNNPSNRLVVSDGPSARSQLTVSDTNTSSLMLRAGASQSSVLASDVGLLIRTGAAWTNADAGGTTAMSILTSGNVGIGTTNPQHKLAVNGTIKAKEIIVETAGWSDYVFADDYRLAPLAEVEAHIKTKKHLPGIPSAAQVAEQGVSVGDMQARLLAKIEELTLHQIAQEKELAALRAEVRDLRASR